MDALRTALYGLLAVTSLGCQSQAADGYLGEPLFGMKGRLELAWEPETELVPVFALVNENEQTVHFVNTQVEGEFPTNFALKVYLPPPAAALSGSRHEDLPGEPKHAFGYIAAVTPDHYPMAYFASTVTNEHRTLDPTCADPCTDEPCRQCTIDELCSPEGCVIKTRATAFDGKRVGDTTYLCPKKYIEDPLNNTTLAECQVTKRSGDPVISMIPDSDYGGFSRDYLVLYLESEAPAGSVIAHSYGSPQGLAAGYHLIRTRMLEPAEQQESMACSDRAIALALERYNAQHGTQHVPSDVPLNCNPDNGLDCDITPEKKMLRGAWLRTRVELDCPEFGYEATPVADPKAPGITIHIGPADPAP